jgi:AAA15 family ATPase/GTPase
VNVFIGAPNVGKSNILEALSLFMYVTKSGVLSESVGLNDIVRFESFVHLLHFGDTSNESFVQFNDSRKCRIEYQNAHRLILKYQYASNVAGGLLPDGNYVFNFSNLNKPEIVPLFKESIEDHIKIVGQYPGIKKYIFSGKNFSNSLSAKDLAVPFGDNLFEVLRYNADVRKEVGELFAQYGLKLSFDSDTKLNVYKELDEFSIFNIPFGQIADTLQRLIFYKTAIQTTKDAVLLFEEPEAHMYPPYIAKFTADIIFDENKNQYFIATHSPFVLTDFIEELERKDLSIYVVGYQKGETVVKRLTDEQISEVVQYGVDLFFNLENYLDDGLVRND